MKMKGGNFEHLYQNGSVMLKNTNETKAVTVKTKEKK